MNEKAKGARTGFSTGACAAAAAKGALMALIGAKSVEKVNWVHPEDERAPFLLSECAFLPGAVQCGVVKDAGDDPDVAQGAVIPRTRFR
ncbi:MAG: cobalt-precorrin-5B (C(1))-methyltransferase [Nitrospiria bacterium]